MGSGLCLKTTCTSFWNVFRTSSRIGSTRAQYGHSKSENTRITIGAVASPRAGSTWATAGTAAAAGACARAAGWTEPAITAAAAASRTMARTDRGTWIADAGTRGPAEPPTIDRRWLLNMVRGHAAPGRRPGFGLKAFIDNQAGRTGRQ